MQKLLKIVEKKHMCKCKFIKKIVKTGEMNLWTCMNFNNISLLTSNHLIRYTIKIFTFSQIQNCQILSMD